MSNVGKKNGNDKNKQAGILTRETIGMVLILFAIIAVVMLVSRGAIFGDVGKAVSSFLLGACGYGSFVLFGLLIFASVLMIVDKRPKIRAKTLILWAMLLIFGFCLAHTITAAIGGIEYNGYAAYLSDCFHAAERADAAGESAFGAATAGGAMCGLIVYPIVWLTTSVGGYIIFSLLIVGTIYLMYSSAKSSAIRAQRAARTPAKTHAQRSREVIAPQPPRASQATDYATSDTSGLYYVNDYANQAPVSPQQPMQQTMAPQQPVQPTAANGYYAGETSAPYADNAYDPSRRLHAVNDEFQFKTRREMRQESRRERDARRMSEEENLSLEEQGHRILYPNRPPRPRTAPNKPAEKRGYSASAPAKSKNDAYNNYINNRIYDESSYFNNPTRGTISKEQYSSNFSSSTSNLWEGHELSSPRSPIPKPYEPPQPEKPASEAPATYSQMYGDNADGNITYSNRPQKILPDPVSAHPADVEQPDVPISTYKADGDLFRKDERADMSAGFDPNRPLSAFMDGTFSQNRGGDAGISAHDIQMNSFNEDDSSIDVGDTARRAGFGGAASRRTDRPFQPADQWDARISDERSARFSNDFAPRMPDDRSGHGPNEPSSRRDVSFGAEEPQQEENRLSRFPTEDGIIIGDRSMPEEKTGLQPISDEFDSAVNLFDDDRTMPGESIVPGVMDQIAKDEGRAVPERAGRSTGRKSEEGGRPRHIYPRYNAPSIDLLRDYQDKFSESAEEIEFNKETIVSTLYNLLRIETTVLRVTHGPAVTRYDIDIPGNVQTARVLGCDRELALRLQAKDGVTVQTNYENGSISIEVPNKNRETVGLKEIIQSPEFVNAKPGSLMFGMGKDIEGRAVCGDITKMKHLLVAGATGSGKSVCLTSLIVSLLFKYSPEELRLILIDPKQTEFSIYEKLPHLLVNEIISDPAKVIPVLDWAINEMERRYSLFKEMTRKRTLVREIDGYNASLKPDEERLPKIVIIMDEVADLMAMAKKDIEDRVQRLTQKSRATGIHLVLATQRPSVDVITGIIKSNLPTRIACKVTQEVDSRTILDSSGAEKLLGRGDMLYKTDAMTFPRRLQGTWLDDGEVQNVVEYVKEHNEAYFDERVYDFINNSRGGSVGGGDGDDSVEAVYIEALKYVVSIGQASISMIQRRCSVGYPKAGKIIEWMENMGYISAFDGAKARKVLLSQEDFDSKYGDYGV